MNGDKAVVEFWKTRKGPRLGTIVEEGSQVTPEEQHDENPEPSFWETRTGNLSGLTLWLSGSVLIAAVAMDWFFVLMAAGLVVTAALIACVIFERRWRASKKLGPQDEPQR